MTERVLIRLGRLNRTLVFLVGVAVVFLGLLLPGITGAAILLALAAGLGWVLARTWVVTAPPVRATRLVILALVLCVAAYKAS